MPLTGAEKQKRYAARWPEKIKARNAITNTQRGDKYHVPRGSAYNSWHAMKQRCNNPNFPQYMDYGGRGITYDPHWEKFANFLADMGERPSGKTLDRIDNDGPYNKDNCKWSTPTEQLYNRRPYRRRAA